MGMDEQRKMRKMVDCRWHLISLAISSWICQLSLCPCHVHPRKPTTAGRQTTCGASARAPDLI